ncbi:hypothetical protein ILYODFUR_017313 [Ilyodon furcidens]|uniref:Uncharacterized protein n=1 Tax=Ilyodon furcidens TaxID=33524 RepID=A0ABV0T8T4_9TELE
MSKILDHLKLVSETWQRVYRTSLVSNRTALGTDDSRHGSSAHNSEATVRCYHVNMEQNLRSMFPHSVESIPRRTKAVLTRIQQGVPNAVADEGMQHNMQRLCQFYQFLVAVMCFWTFDHLMVSPMVAVTLTSEALHAFRNFPAVSHCLCVHFDHRLDP